jgi:hypothetical protein
MFRMGLPAMVLVRGLRTAVLLAAACTAGFADTLVLPNAQATAAGNQPVHLGSKATRIQEVIGGGQFAQFNGPITITGIHFRSAPGTGPVNVSTNSYKITLSTTQVFPNTKNGHTLPSLTYASNVGPDATVVYNAAITGSSPGCNAPGPCPFDLSIPFSMPFVFNPLNGRLLVDVVSGGPTGTPQGSLDGVIFPDNINSTVAIVTGDPSQATGTLFIGGIVIELDISSATSAYSLPQLAFGGGWYTAAYFTNTTAGQVSFEASFVGNDGTPLNVPSVGGSSTMVNIMANGTAIIELPNVGQLTQGYIAVSLPAGVVGYGVFRSSVAGRNDQEAVVPLSSAATTTSTLIWDDTSYVTAVAVVNPSSVPVTVSITVWDSSGNIIGTSSIPLAAKSKTAAALHDLPGLGAVVGKRGSAQFTVAAGNVAVLGLRFNNAAFTSIPTADK